jgi:hypothetical protein
MREQIRCWQHDALCAVSAAIYFYLFGGVVQAFAHFLH